MSWKNEHPSENLEIGALMSQQKNQKVKKSKKIKKVPWWKPGNRHLGSKNSKYKKIIKSPEKNPK